MAATLVPVVNPDTSEPGNLTRRELTVLALVLAIIAVSVLLLVIASGQVAAALAATPTH